MSAGNIMLTKSGAKLLDFGLAKVRRLRVKPETFVKWQRTAFPIFWLTVAQLKVTALNDKKPR
jgi:hypothetical protein